MLIDTKLTAVPDVLAYIVAAYEQLLVEGFVRTVIGSGYYVEKIEISQ